MKTLFSSRRHQYLAMVCIFLVTTALIAGMAGCDGNGNGNGYTPPSQNLEIYDWYDLDAVRNNLAGNHTLMNDLDSTTAGYEELASATANQGKGWEPIGASDNRFTGILAGQGYEIRDLFINRPNEDCVGFFGYVGGGGVIRDIGARNVVVTGHDWIGGLVGHNDGTVIDSYSIGSVTGEKYFGGLVGYDSGNTVSNSYYNYDESLINGENMITTGALYANNFEEWLANNKFLDVSERLSQEDGYYLIESVSDFKELLAFGQNATLKFRLTNDLDLGDEPNFYIPYMAGEFDGDSHVISNLSLNLSAVWKLGLFGHLLPSGNITELGVENLNTTGESLVGGLVGHNRGSVSNCHSTGSVTGYEFVGGLVGYSPGTVSDSHSSGNVSGERGVGGAVGHNEGGIVSSAYFTGSVTSDSGQGVGGLVGENWQGTISNSHFAGDVGGYVDQADWVGGLVGWNEGAINNSYASGNVTGDGQVGGLVGMHYDGIIKSCNFNGNVAGHVYTGGLVGKHNDGALSDSYSIASVTGEWYPGGLVGWHVRGSVNNCYSISDVTGETFVGGLVGHNEEATIAESYSCGTVTGGPDGVGIGGLVGRNKATVSNSYSMSMVTGWDDTSSVGGLVGANMEAGTVTNSYSTGSVTGDSSAGGLVGFNDGTVTNSYSTGSVTGDWRAGGLVVFNDGTVTNSFWDTQTSGQATSAGGEGKTTAEMQDIATFSGATWDIVAVANPSIRNLAYIWNIVDDETYPFLSWQS